MADSIATVVSTKVLSPVSAAGLAAIFNFPGMDSDNYKQKAKSGQISEFIDLSALVEIGRIELPTL